MVWSFLCMISGQNSIGNIGVAALAKHLHPIEQYLLSNSSYLALTKFLSFPLTHSFIHSLTRLRAHSPTRLVLPGFILSLFLAHMYSLVSPVRSFCPIRWWPIVWGGGCYAFFFIRSIVRLLIFKVTHPPTQFLTLSLTHSVMNPFTHPPSHSFIYWTTHCLTRIHSHAYTQA